MTPTNYLSAAALVVAALAMVINLITMVRAGQWRNSDDGKAVNLKMGDLRRDVTIIQTKMEALPTAADVAKLTTEVSVMRAVSNANHDLLIATRNQLNRIEGFFLEAKT